MTTTYRPTRDELDECIARLMDERAKLEDSPRSEISICYGIDGYIPWITVDDKRITFDACATHEEAERRALLYARTRERVALLEGLVVHIWRDRH